MLPKKKCKRCGHEWILRKEKPTVCPACKSPYWNQDRILNFKDEDNMLEENLEKKEMKNMRQKEIESKEPRWVEDEETFEDDADVVKLEIDQSISGILVEKKPSDTFGYIYKLKVKDDERLKIICGTTVLNKKMVNKQEGSEIMIERVKNEKNKKGREYHNFKVYHNEGE